MLENFLHTPWIELVLVIIAGFLIGLEIKTHRRGNEAQKEIGSVRTFTFIALIGYIFAKTDMFLYMVGYLAIVVHFSIFYYFRLKDKYSSISIFLLFTLVYSFGIVVVKYSIWFLLIIFVVVVFIYNLNRRLEHFYTIFDANEVETFAKLLLVSGVILPLLPHEQIADFIPISYFKIWLAVVIVSLFSYVGYILKKYLFHEKGYLLTGILGGIYSSTATTVVLAKKASDNSTPYLFTSAIVIATTLMYFRLIGIAFAFNVNIAYKLILPYSLLVLLSIIIVAVLYHRSRNDKSKIVEENGDKNPLELSTAFFFAILFLLMVTVTHFVLNTYGEMGLNMLSFIVGFTDTDPFVLSILSSKFDISIDSAATAILIASGSNNILKAFSAYIFAKNKTGIMSASILILLGALTIISGFII
ncbi:DUF4010 domain-containing protein [Sulfurimonas sp. C5]|uniref:MgtC/SapB family protein n=1 Tax=Sulfurimonas sp. C5 TaxID=3036947 RepID=UPI002456B0BD|nr:DUF4010 domain-containing protein [Sulfurimonas sp. C5]MDH4943848.1 DUF4010 domain-containing protein [Sulfurimonas sp. C5]